MGAADALMDNGRPAGFTESLSLGALKAFIQKMSRNGNRG